jgi:hypothetical protein
MIGLCVGARLKCHSARKVEMTPLASGTATPPNIIAVPSVGRQLLERVPDRHAAVGPLLAYRVPPDCSVAVAATGHSDAASLIGCLLRFHHRQCRAQSFVLDDCALRYRLDLVEHPKRQRGAFKLHSKPAVRVVHHFNFPARQPACERGRVEQ